MTTVRVVDPGTMGGPIAGRLLASRGRDIAALHELLARLGETAALA